MRRPVSSLFGRLKLVLHLVLALVAFAPAVSAHACVEENCAAVAVVGETVSEQGQDQPGCIDCGPACANGCCHAPNVATTPDLTPIQAPAVETARRVWPQSSAPPPVEPSGPRRPPRA